MNDPQHLLLPDNRTIVKPVPPSNTTGLKTSKFNRYDNYIEDRPGVLVEKVNSPPESIEVQEKLKFNNQLSSHEFLVILTLVFVGVVAFMANALSNPEIVDIEARYGWGVPMVWLLVLVSIVGILTAQMVYQPYILDRANNRYVVITALVLFIFAQIFWSLALFHSRINRGTAGLAGVLLLAATVWLGWVCYHFVPQIIVIFLVLLAWTFYLQAYTYNVDAKPWNAVDAFIPVDF
jgi:hypothetical protein